MKKNVLLTAVLAALILLTTAGLTAARQDNAASSETTAPNQPLAKEYRIERSMPREALACLECHKRESPGLFADWAMSRHASVQHHLPGLPPGRGIRSRRQPDPL